MTCGQSPRVWRSSGAAAGELRGSPRADGLRFSAAGFYPDALGAITDARTRVRDDPAGMASAQASSPTAAVARGPQRRRSLHQALGWGVEHRSRILAGIAACSIVVGGALYLAGEQAAGSDVWAAAVALLAAELAVEVVRTVIVDHHMGVDTIALVAMVGALALGEEFAGVIIGLMFSGGATLEDVASARARRELTALIQRAPKVAQLRVGEQIEQVPVAEVQAGDVVVVRTGEVVPVDGTVVGAEAVVDTSTLSGEPLPVTIGPGMAVLSGSANAGSPFDVRADKPAARAPTPRSSGWSSRRRRTGRRSCGWPTGTPGSSCPRR